MYEGAAATTGYPYLEAEVRYAVTSREVLTSVFEVCRSMEVAGVLILRPQLTFSRIQNSTSRSFAHDFPSNFLWFVIFSATSGKLSQVPPSSTKVPGGEPVVVCDLAHF